MQNYVFARCFVWVLNLVSRMKERTQDESFREYDAEEDIWT